MFENSKPTGIKTYFPHQANIAVDCLLELAAAKKDPLSSFLLLTASRAVITICLYSLYNIIYPRAHFAKRILNEGSSYVRSLEEWSTILQVYYYTCTHSVQVSWEYTAVFTARQGKAEPLRNCKRSLKAQKSLVRDYNNSPRSLCAWRYSGSLISCAWVVLV